MAFNNTGTKQSAVDSGIGLVMRLNYLWSRADAHCLQGQMDDWNHVLDRIYCNLLYREEMVDKRDEVTKKIISVSLNDTEIERFDYFKDKIRELKIQMNKCMNKRDRPGYIQAKEDYYNSLMEKDIWLRKFMTVLGLYLKEYDQHTNSAIFRGNS